MVRTGLAGGGRWIRTLGPALHTYRFGPPLVGSVTVPFAKTEITLSRPGTERSKPASAAECTGQPPGGFPLARYRRRRGWGDLRRSAYGTPRAMWCAPATIADGIEEFLEVQYLCMGGTDRSLTGLEARGERWSILNPLTRPLRRVGSV
jgi:hypothetical protein